MPNGLAGPAALVGVVVMAGLVSGACTSPHAGQTVDITLTDDGCAPQQRTVAAGSVRFEITDSGADHVSEVELVRDDRVVGERENLAPGRHGNFVATVTPGSYELRCPGAETEQADLVVSGAIPASTAPDQLVSVAGPLHSIRVDDLDLLGPVTEYETFVGQQFAVEQQQISSLVNDTASGQLTAAQDDWLAAHQTWHRVGAAYDALGDLSAEIDGTPAGHEGGIDDPTFTGFHRVEYDLWQTGDLATAHTDAAALAGFFTQAQSQFPAAQIVPSDLPLRTHEILEDAVRDELTGHDDLGSGTSLASVDADIDATRELLTVLAPLLALRAPQLEQLAGAQLDRLHTAIVATEVNGQWIPITRVSLASRQEIDGAAGQVLEILAPVPDLLETDD